MTISDRTRKLLWARSGNRCAYCRQVLTVDASAHDREAVIGDECHISAQRPEGPRFELGCDSVDECENLILLCKTHHKLIDDQPVKFDVTNLKRMKAKHEAWVQQSLSSQVLARAESTVTVAVNTRGQLQVGEAAVRYLRKQLCKECGVMER
jgi:hypothetical protein